VPFRFPPLLLHPEIQSFFSCFIPASMPSFSSIYCIPRDVALFFPLFFLLSPPPPSAPFCNGPDPSGEFLSSTICSSAESIVPSFSFLLVFYGSLHPSSPFLPPLLFFFSRTTFRSPIVLVLLFSVPSLCLCCPPRTCRAPIGSRSKTHCWMSLCSFSFSP